MKGYGYEQIMEGHGYEQIMEGHGSNAHERKVEGNEINTKKVT